jgi:hypothetical protein
MGRQRYLWRLAAFFFPSLVSAPRILLRYAEHKQEKYDAHHLDRDVRCLGMLGGER